MTTRLRDKSLLSLFGGAGALAAELAKEGMDALLIDTAHSPQNNLANARVARTIDGILPLFDLLGIDLPCCTWSRARRAPRHSPFPSALRSNQFIMGLPDLPERDRSTLALHNKLYRLSIRWAKGSLCAGKSGYIENPATSMLWKSKGVRRLIKLGAYFFVLDM